MQLELVGCTSAGKSTLAERIVAAAQSQGVDLVLGDEFIMNKMRLNHLRSRGMRAVAVHLVAFWECVFKAWCHRQFIRIACGELRQANIPWFQKWNQLRKVLKQLGRYQYIGSRNNKNSLVVVDEGTLHTAHNLFVHVTGQVSEQRVQAFAESVPLPDIVIYVREPEDVLIERTLRRGHRRISNPTSQVVADFVHQAVAAFEQLSKHPRIAPRLLVIENEEVVVPAAHQTTPELERILPMIRAILAPEIDSTNHVSFSPSAPAPCGIL